MTLYHHLGLGDHIICNGLVRHFCSENKSVQLFCLKSNSKNVEYMYRDLKNLHLIEVTSDHEAVQKIINEKLNVLKIGFEKLSYSSDASFDAEFYKCAELPFEYKFDKFHIQRDTKKELTILNELNPTNNKYIFIHGDNVNPKKIRQDLKIINNPIQYSLFDLISLFENAEEIHVVESSLKCLINQIILTKPKLYHHKYGNKYSNLYPEFHTSKGLNKFEIIKN